MLCLVWMADIAAYFGGKAFGRRKLAPAISPRQELGGCVQRGLWGVMILGLLSGWPWTAIFNLDSASLYTSLQQAQRHLRADRGRAVPDSLERGR